MKHRISTLSVSGLRPAVGSRPPTISTFSLRPTDWSAPLMPGRTASARSTIDGRSSQDPDHREHRSPVT